jgi:hypothetical protein
LRSAQISQTLAGSRSCEQSRPFSSSSLNGSGRSPFEFAVTRVLSSPRASARSDSQVRQAVRTPGRLMDCQERLDLLEVSLACFFWVWLGGRLSTHPLTLQEGIAQSGRIPVLALTVSFHFVTLTSNLCGNVVLLVSDRRLPEGFAFRFSGHSRNWLGLFFRCPRRFYRTDLNLRTGR